MKTKPQWYRWLAVLVWPIVIPVRYIYFGVPGLFVVPFGLVYRHVVGHWPSPCWLWWNDEDGASPSWYITNEWRGWPVWWNHFVWLTFRNSVNNHRFLFDDSKSFIEWSPQGWDTELHGSLEAGQMLKVSEIPDSAITLWRFRGWQASWRRVVLEDERDYSEYFVGFKIGGSTPGCGITLQRRVKRRIGT